MLVPGALFNEWRQYNQNEKPNCRTPANWHNKDLKAKANVQMLTSLGENSSDVQMSLHGACSKFYPNKSFRIIVDGAGFPLNIYPDQFDHYKTFILRNAGNDNEFAYLRDVLVQKIAKNMNVETQGHQSVTLMLNGEYYGIRHIRQRYDRHYFKRKYEIGRHDYDHISGWFNVKAGDLVKVHELDALITKIDFNNNDYAKFKKIADHRNFIDYFILNIFVNNTDWPGGNFDFWRYRNTQLSKSNQFLDGRWRWLVYDTDYGLGLVNGYEFNSLAPNRSRSWVKGLFNNDIFIQEFVVRFTDLLNSDLNVNRTIQALEELVLELKGDMPLHVLRWSRPESNSHWLNNIEVIKEYLINRPSMQRKHLQEVFNLNELYKVEFLIQNFKDGCLGLNTIGICGENNGSGNKQWQGQYFKNMPITIDVKNLNQKILYFRVNGLDIDVSNVLYLTPSEDLKIEIRLAD